MKTRRVFSGRKALLSNVLVVTAFFLGCNEASQTKQAASRAAATGSATVDKVFVQFEGPWAFATDPKDATMLYAIAPKTAGHRDLYVKSSNQSPLAAGAYTLAIAPRGPASTSGDDPGIYRTASDPAAVQRALDSKGARYSIHLPKPEAYKAANRFRSRVGPKYPPTDNPENDYATEVALVYTVSSLSGFSLSGSPDAGNFSPMLLQVETPVIRFVIEPAQDDDPADQCSIHSRESFRDLTKLLSLTLYVDFPADTGTDCHDKDPQNPNAAKAKPAKKASLELEPTTQGIGSTEPIVQAATGANPVLGLLLQFSSGVVVRESMQRHLASVLYLFGHPMGNCKAPVVILEP